LRGDLGVTADRHCSHAISGFAFPGDKFLRKLARILEYAWRNGATSIEYERCRERFTASDEGRLRNGAHKSKDNKRAEEEARPPLPSLLVAAATPRQQHDRHQQRKEQEKDGSLKLHVHSDVRD
jgi:hypothetical protein